VAYTLLSKLKRVAPGNDPSLHQGWGPGGGVRLGCVSEAGSQAARAGRDVRLGGRGVAIFQDQPYGAETPASLHPARGGESQRRPEHPRSVHPKLTPPPGQLFSEKRPANPPAQTQPP
jgi:hypothetical protein